MPNQRITPLDWRTPIVDDKGCPTSQFLRLWLQQLGNGDNYQQEIDALAAELDQKADKSETISSVSGETSGGGDLSAPRSIGLADTAVTPGTYGDSTHVARVTIDQKGRVTAASNVTISGGGGGGVYMPVVDGSIPPNLVYLPDGNLVYVQVA